MIISNTERKIISKALKMVHLNTEQEKTLLHRIENEDSYASRLQQQKQREMNFKMWLTATYGSNAYKHEHEYFEYCKRNGF